MPAWEGRVAVRLTDRAVGNREACRDWWVAAAVAVVLVAVGAVASASVLWVLMDPVMRLRAMAAPLVLAGGAALVAVAASRRGLVAATTILAVSTAAFYAALARDVMPRIRGLHPYAGLGQAIRSLPRPPARVGCLGGDARASPVFYSGRNVEPLAVPTEVARFLDAPGPACAVLPASELVEVRRLAPGRVHVLAREAKAVVRFNRLWGDRALREADIALISNEGPWRTTPDP